MWLLHYILCVFIKPRIAITVRTAFGVFIAYVIFVQAIQPFGLLSVGMIAHGLWDISTFLPAPESNEYYLGFELVALSLAVIAAIVVAVAAFFHDRNLVVSRDGVLITDENRESK